MDLNKTNFLSRFVFLELLVRTQTNGGFDILWCSWALKNWGPILGLVILIRL